MLELEKDPKRIGENLRIKILEKYGSIRKFCRAYLEERDGSTDDEEIRKLLNRFSQILKGTKNIQITDLPYVTKLLDASCEEILSAGKQYVPVSGRMTNYDIALSHDQETWEKYMNREDRLFLNCDEYCKSVLDYAFDFKNYEFLKYLLDKGFIWFVDQSDMKHMGLSYGAGTSVKRRDVGETDSYTSLEIEYQDDLRIRMITLAIENEDYEILDSLKARELPEMEMITAVGAPMPELYKRRNERIITAIASSEDSILHYFSEEYRIKDRFGKDRAMLYPFYGAVIETMIKQQHDNSAKLFLQKAIRHNEGAFEKLKVMLEEATNSFRADWMDDDKIARKIALNWFNYDSANCMVSFYYLNRKKETKGFATNIVRVESKTRNPLLNEMITKVNESYAKIVALREKEA